MDLEENAKELLQICLKSIHDEPALLLPGIWRREYPWHSLFSVKCQGSRSDKDLQSMRVLLRPEQRFSKDGVQWLANDPMSTKKKKHVRKGRNVISKSRQFEKDMEDVIIVENNIARGSVVNQKKWLQEAFHEDRDDDLGSLRSTNFDY